MTCSYSLLDSPSRSSQQGMVLIVGLVMVLLLTIIGLAAIRGSGLQENMAFNMRDRTVATQAAESGLRFCEAIVRNFLQVPAALCLPGGGICNDLTGTPNSPSNGNAWLALAFDTGQPQQGVPALNLPVPTQPRCLIEIVPDVQQQCPLFKGNGISVNAQANNINCPTAYRVTSQGVGAEATTQVVVQSVFNR